VTKHTRKQTFQSFEYRSITKIDNRMIYLDRNVNYYREEKLDRENFDLRRNNRFVHLMPYLEHKFRFHTFASIWLVRCHHPMSHLVVENRRIVDAVVFLVQCREKHEGEEKIKTKVRQWKINLDKSIDNNQHWFDRE
jgi:hypothetical protein